MLFDLHVHSRYSACSRLSLADIIAHASERSLDGVCITDHHSVEALSRIGQGIQPNGLRLFIGQEVDTDHGDFLIFGPTTPFPRNMGAVDLLKWVKDLGGAAIAAHPFRPARPTSEFIVRDNLCRIVEGVNGRNNKMDNQRVAQWRRRYPLIECAGSDAHSLGELGTCKTRFEVPIDTLQDLIDALNRGLCSPDNSRRIALPSETHIRRVA